MELEDLLLQAAQTNEVGDPPVGLSEMQSQIDTLQANFTAQEAQVVSLTQELEVARQELAQAQQVSQVLLAPMARVVQRMAVAAGKSLDASSLSAAELAEKFTEMQTALSKIPVTRVSRDVPPAAPLTPKVSAKETSILNKARALRVGNY